MFLRESQPADTPFLNQYLHTLPNFVQSAFSLSNPNHRIFLLEKTKQIIGVGILYFALQTLWTNPIPLLWIEIFPNWQRKGYGTYLFKQLLHKNRAFQESTIGIVFDTCCCGCAEFLQKFGFCFSQQASSHPNLQLWLYHQHKQLTSLSFCHQLLATKVKSGDFIVDATAGLGRDTLYLCQLVGEQGQVLALDIQPQAVEATNLLLQKHNLHSVGKAILANHANLLEYVSPNSIDGIVFNFGWLPSGDHTVFTTPKTSIPALEAGLNALKTGGFLIASIYYGGTNGTEEKDCLIPWFASLPYTQYSVIQCNFANRQGKDPLVFFIQKEK